MILFKEFLGTIKYNINYKNVLLSFFEYLNRNNIGLEDVDKEIIKDFLRTMTTVKKSTQLKRIKIINSYYRFLIKNKKIKRDNYFFTKNVIPEDKIIKTTAFDIVRNKNVFLNMLKNSNSNNESKLIIALIYSGILGPEFKELSILKEDIDLTNDTLVINRHNYATKDTYRKTIKIEPYLKSLIEKQLQKYTEDKYLLKNYYKITFRDRISKFFEQYNIILEAKDILDLGSLHYVLDVYNNKNISIKSSIDFRNILIDSNYPVPSLGNKRLYNIFKSRVPIDNKNKKDNSKYIKSKRLEDIYILN